MEQIRCFGDTPIYIANVIYDIPLVSQNTVQVVFVKLYNK